MLRLNNLLPIWRLQRLRELAPRMVELVSKERRSPLGSSVPFRDRMGLWKSGFLSESALIYDFAKYSNRDYLSDYSQFTKVRINGAYTSLLSNKIMFNAVMGRFRLNLPIAYAVILDRRYRYMSETPRLRSLDEVVSWCVAGNSLVLKPYRGRAGQGILVIEARSEGLFCNGECTNENALSALFKRLDGYLIEQKVEQADYAASIYPGATNTIRAMTMWDSKVDEPFLAVAVHRFGTRQSHPVDNWTRGGLSAAIDLDTGVMSKAVTYPRNGSLDWQESHPDTGERIAGVSIPKWNEIHGNLLTIARAFPFWRYVGWDIVLDQGGEVKILEGNSRSDVNLLQVHAPLLLDDRVRRFYNQN